MNATRSWTRVLPALGIAGLLAGGAWAADPPPAEVVPAACSQPAATRPAASPACPEPMVVRATNGRIDLHARNMEVVSALIQLRQLERRNIVVSPKVTGTVSLDLYGVTFDEALEAVLRSANLVARQDNSFTYVCTPTEADERFAPRRALSSRVFLLAYAGAEDVMKLLQPLLSRDGRLSATIASQKGIPTNKEAAGGNEYAAADTVVVVDYPENIERMQAVVASVDVRPRQVLIEATILAASLMDDNSMGVDFTALCGIDFKTITATSPGGQSITLGELPPDQLDKSTTAVSTDFLTGMPKGGLKVGYIKNGVAVFIQALEQVTDTVVLANPKVLVLNKQRGEVMVGRRDGYRTTITTETTTIENVQFLETGTRLIFRPFIGNDGYVRLEIHPEDSTGGLTEAGLPFEETAEVTTNIVVRDGTTIVIGGLFRDNTRTKRGQVPLLGEIPVLGAAFRRSRDEALKQEVIILLTPHVLDDPARDAVARELLADAERIRVGMRQGLQWHGRERLAQAYFRAASDHLRQGHRSLALWEANAAIGLQPTFLDAIRMREQILDKQMSEPAGSAIKDMVMKRILQPPDEAECRSQRTDRPSPEKPAQVSAATHDTPSAGAPGPANEPSKGADGP
jgi:type IV pilus assembly protein PilQ